MNWTGGLILFQDPSKSAMNQQHLKRELPELKREITRVCQFFFNWWEMVSTLNASEPTPKPHCCCLWFRAEYVALISRKIHKLFKTSSFPDSLQVTMETEADSDPPLFHMCLLRWWAVIVCRCKTYLLREMLQAFCVFNEICRCEPQQEAVLKRMIY